MLTPVRYAVAGYMANDAILNAPMTLTQIGGHNPTGVALYVLVFDLAAAPGATRPIMSFSVPAGASFSWEPPEGGYPLVNGCRWYVSSAGDTYVALAQNVWVYAMGYAS